MRRAAAAFAVPLYASFLALGHHVPLALALFAVPVGGLATAFPLPGRLGGSRWPWPPCSQS